MRFLSLYSINYEIPSGRTVDRHFAIKRLVEVSIIALQLSRESYTALPGLTIMDSKEEQPLNASSPIEVTLSGITIDFKEEQPQNAPSPIEVTLSGIMIDFKKRQLLNAYSPIEVTPSGMTMNSNEEQPLNAYSPIEVTLSGMTVDLQPTSSLLVAVSMTALQLSRESYTALPGLTTMDSNEKQS